MPVEIFIVRVDDLPPRYLAVGGDAPRKRGYGPSINDAVVALAIDLGLLTIDQADDEEPEVAGTSAVPTPIAVAAPSAPSAPAGFAQGLTWEQAQAAMAQGKKVAQINDPSGNYLTDDPGMKPHWALHVMLPKDPANPNAPQKQAAVVHWPQKAPSKCAITRGMLQ